MDTELNYYERKFSYWPIKLANNQQCWLTYYYAKVTVRIRRPPETYCVYLTADSYMRASSLTLFRISAADYLIDKILGHATGPDKYRPDFRALEHTYVYGDNNA